MKYQNEGGPDLAQCFDLVRRITRPSAPQVLRMFDWNPLFHCIDQARGEMFLNYTPHHTSLTYPLYVSLACLMIGLMGEFVTRNNVSLSWSAGR